MMQILSVLAVLSTLLTVSPAHAGMGSPFPPDKGLADLGIEIPNAHVVTGTMDEGTSAVVRGQAPKDEIPDLFANGVTDFLIFKNQTGTEVDEELEALAKDPFKLTKTNGHVKHIDFPWQGIRDDDFVEACTQVVVGLKYLRAATTKPGRKVYFHCTVGEDRTGLLAGLWRSLNDGWSMRSSFFFEMCENGYEAGNPDKPEYVVKRIREALTPLYVKMGFLFEKKVLTLEALDKMDLELDDVAAVCARDPKTDPQWKKEFAQNERFNAKKYVCKTSSKYPGFNPADPQSSSKPKP